MKLATYTGEMLTADFNESTITFEIEGNFSVRAGKYFIFSESDLENFADMICRELLSSCQKIINETWECGINESLEKYSHFREIYHNDILKKTEHLKIEGL